MSLSSKNPIQYKSRSGQILHAIRIVCSASLVLVQTRFLFLSDWAEFDVRPNSEMLISYIVCIRPNRTNLTKRMVVLPFSSNTI